jgi:ABC-type methionine transport system ATPase subunit
MTPPTRLKLTFPEHLIKQPVMARLVRDFDVTPNIRQAKIEATVGWIVCELGGERARIDEAVKWLRETGVEVDLLGDVLES